MFKHSAAHAAVSLASFGPMGLVCNQTITVDYCTGFSVKKVFIAFSITSLKFCTNSKACNCVNVVLSFYHKLSGSFCVGNSMIQKNIEAKKILQNPHNR